MWTLRPHRQYISQTACGTANFAVPPQVVTGFDVEFGVDFDATPCVVVCPQTNYPQNFSVSITAVSRSGFRINVHNSSMTEGNMYVCWIATAPCT